jgi:oligopeptide transport system substrate-binding protein
MRRLTASAVLVAFALAVVLGIPSCEPGPDSPGGGKPGPRGSSPPAGTTAAAGSLEPDAPLAADQTFRFNNGAEPETLDPAKMTGVPEHRLAMALFEGLVVYHPQTLDPQPGIAERWDVSSDGLVYTFHLRKSLWSNGDPLTARDFAYSWRRALAPDTAAEYAYMLWPIRNARGFTEGTINDFAEVGVRVVDDHTLEVTLAHPTAYFLDLVAFETYMPVHRGCIDEHGERWPRPGNIVSNGPFVLEIWKPHQRIEMAANPNYWDAKTVRLDRIVALPISNENTALRAYKEGRIDWLSSMPSAAIAKLKERKDFHVSPYFGTWFFRFNCTRKPFDDPRVRMAFNLAFNKVELCKYVLQEQYEPARSFVPPMLSDYDPPRGPAFDPKRAAKLLAEAGYPGGRGFPRVTLLYNTNKRNKEVATVAQQAWKKHLGVEVNLLNQEWKVYLQTTNRLEYDIARSAWIGDYMDPNTFLDMFVTDGGNNRTGWSNAEYDRLIVAAAREVDAAERAGLFRKAEQLLVQEELPVMPVYYYANLSLRHPRLRGFWSNPRDLHPFKYIWMAAEE